MGSRSKLLLFYFILLFDFSFCTPGSDRRNQAAKSLHDFSTVAQGKLDSSAATMIDSTVGSGENEEAAYQPIPFDTAQQAGVRPFDKDKWKKKVESLDYSEEHFERKVAPGGVSSLPFNFPQFGKIILVALVIGLLAFLIWRMMATPPSNNKDEKEASLIFSEDHPEKMGSSELDELLKNYLKEKNYRFAIRILYLITLKRFSEKQLIHWNKEKTNRNYIYELAGTPVQQGFSLLTSFYDTVWYGEHHVNEQQFEQVNKIAVQILKASNPSSSGIQ